VIAGVRETMDRVTGPEHRGVSGGPVCPHAGGSIKNEDDLVMDRSRVPSASAN
jgi:hypothetical protein